MVRESRVRRRTQACARCRTRKIHCDALPAACSSCAAARVPCVALNATKNQAVPRSIAQFLESKIAEREHEKATRGAIVKVVADRGFANPAVNLFLDTITPSFLGLSAAVPLARCVVAGTRLPSARMVLGAVNDVHEHHPRSIINPHPTSTPLSSVPVHVADFLFQNYINRVAPQYPIYYIPDLESMHNCVFHPEIEAPESRSSVTVTVTPYQVFTLSLIMAISLSTAARSKQARANSIASGLFENAMERISSVLSNDLQGIQALTLLAQYTFLNPGVSNFWLLSGFISQACIDMGLHHELPKGCGMSALDRDMRRRVFWCAWEIEIAVCGALLMPITLLRSKITAEFPSQLEDSAITEAGIDHKGRVTKFTSHCIWRYREIECDIVPVLFHGEPIPARFASLDEWMKHQEEAILRWKAEIHEATARNTDQLAQSQWDEMQLYSDIATDYILVTLFRPCPRIREPTAENLLKAFSSAVGVADGSWKQANLGFGSSKYVFHSCYHSFSAAVAFLQALQRIKPEIAAAYTWSHVEANMSTFSRFFATVAERWPAASRCLEEYEKLLALVRKDFTDFLVQDEAQRASEQSSSLDQLVTSVMGGDSAYDLEEAVTFGNFLNATTTPGLQYSMDYYSHMPVDWNEEFNFGVEEMPPYG